MQGVIRLTAFAVILTAITLALPSDALAQVACNFEGNNTLDCVLDSFRATTRDWQSRLAGLAITLFWILATIEFTWAAIQLAFRGADLGDWLTMLVNQVLFIGFFAALLQFSAEWAGAIVASFQEAANIAGGTNLIRPSDIFDVGVQLATSLYDASSNWNIVHNIVLVVAGFFLLLSFGLIAASLIVALVESYIVISASVLFMGFGGSRWTKDYAIRIFQYAMSVGAKLFVIQLLAGLTIAIVEPWASLAAGESTLSSASLTSIFVLVGVSVIFVAITKVIPEMVQSLINGTSLSRGEGLFATAGRVASGAAAGVVGGAMAARSATRLASEQLRSAEAEGTAPRSAVGRALYVPARTAGNLGKEAANDIGTRLGGRMTKWSQSMDGHRQSLKSKRRANAERRMRGGPSGSKPSEEPKGSGNDKDR